PPRTCHVLGRGRRGARCDPRSRFFGGGGSLPSHGGPGATPEGSAGPPPSERSPPGTGETLITEGRATIVFPSANEVFYNPVQGFNRDLT
uniref:Uncharacterized protein n=1 Tax=Junco hyemalis TaxID=40217 RepID=A0A8C5NLG9_JUNHY